MLYRRIHDRFDDPRVFNAYQRLFDAGKARRIRDFLSGVPYESVLDVGCGTGNWAATARASYLGVDVSPTFIDAARERYSDDGSKKFAVLDPTTEEVPGTFDLAQLISVLHHLSDAQVEALLDQIIPKTSYVFVLDLYPIPWNPAARFLYAADRGYFIRTPAEQRGLLLRDDRLRLLKEGDYFAPGWLYRHTMLLLERL